MISKPFIWLFNSNSKENTDQSEKYHMSSMRNRNCKAFSLAEFLVTLTILAVIMAYSIPKVLNSQNSQKYNAIAKEFASSVSAAWFNYKQSHFLSSSINMAVILPYINHIGADNSSKLGDNQFHSPYTFDCANVNTGCYKLSNGAVFALFNNLYTYVPNVNGVLWFHIDPDGDGPIFGQSFALYTVNGRVTDEGNLISGTTDSTGQTYSACPSCSPEWWNQW